MQNIIDYLEEILIILGFLMFITFGFMSVSLFILAFLTIIYKKKVGEDSEGK